MFNTKETTGAAPGIYTRRQQPGGITPAGSRRQLETPGGSWRKLENIEKSGGLAAAVAGPFFVFCNFGYTTIFRKYNNIVVNPFRIYNKRIATGPPKMLQEKQENARQVIYIYCVEITTAATGQCLL